MEQAKLELWKKEEIEGTYTFRDLYEDMLEEIERYEKLGKLEGLMNSKVYLEILDRKGSVLSGSMNFSAGYLEGEIYNVQGALDNYYEQD